MDDHARGSTSTIRVFLLDDHPLVREALMEHLDGDPELTVVGTAGDVQAALDGIAATRPDVAVLDARLRHSSGMTVCRAVRAQYPEVRCVLLTSHPDRDAFVAARLAGASGYLVKGLAGTVLLDGIKTVARGGTLFTNAPTASLQPLVEDLVDRRGVTLTPDQHRVLTRAVRGDSDEQIAEETSRSTADVRGLLDIVFEGLGLGGAAAAG